MGNILYVFTLRGCQECDDLKRRLNMEKFSYNELEINDYEDVWNEVVKKTNQDFVPTLFIDNNEGNGRIYTPITDYDDTEGIMKIIYENIKRD